MAARTIFCELLMRPLNSSEPHMLTHTLRRLSAVQACACSSSLKDTTLHSTPHLEPFLGPSPCHHVTFTPQELAACSREVEAAINLVRLPCRTGSAPQCGAHFARACWIGPGAGLQSRADSCLLHAQATMSQATSDIPLEVLANAAIALAVPLIIGFFTFKGRPTVQRLGEGSTAPAEAAVTPSRPATGALP